jgi:hypothetical protein
MAEDHKDRLPHLLLYDTASTERYTRPGTGGGPKFKLPSRTRAQHAEALLQHFEAARAQEASIIQEQKAFGLDVGNGLYLTFESEPGFELKFQSLEFEPSGIELCSVKEFEDREVATVFVPEEKLERFLNKIVRYRDEDKKGKPGEPREGELIESISAIKLAALEQLFTDDPALFPEDDQAIWWEVWLRSSDKIDFEAFLREHAEQLGMHVGKEYIRFLDRTVVLVHGTKAQMTRSIRLLGAIAEVRLAKDTADFYIGMGRQEQQDWINDALERILPPPEGAPAVCLLDTGLNEQHPLLQLVADPTDMHSYDAPNWGTDDRYGHGTPMGGLAAYGDLTEPLSSNDPIELSHRLESVKIMPEPGHHQDKHLYGAIIRESISRVKIERPDRNRTFCMAVTTTDDRDRGRPSSWSAAIDALASGAEDDIRHLIILSAGNTDPDERHRFPDSNHTDEVHDPGQAWNALTVGGYTEKIQLDSAQYPGWQTVAPAGDLSPSSCTSMEWQKTWPIKPDILMEAGNMAISPDDGSADYIDDALQLLTTGHKFALDKQLVSFGDTSAASALAARLAAKVQAQYPGCWPETVRALLAHSATWTDAMQARILPANPKQSDYRKLLRYCGYGVPDEVALLWSTSNALTLIAQESLQPFFKDDDKKVKTRDIHLHALPWPVEVLQELGDTEVEMRVTLSYFIEPNPGERGWANKYRYASHGLRFAVRRPLETEQQFHQRINQKARDEKYQKLTAQDQGWALGEKLHNFGSIHSDTWKGTAAELAARGQVGIYPVLGWWKERPKLERWGKQTRYALIISIRTPSVETDIYTPVANQIGIPVTV